MWVRGQLAGSLSVQDAARRRTRPSKAASQLTIAQQKQIARSLKQANAQLGALIEEIQQIPMVTPLK